MNISYNWLHQYINSYQSVEELSEILTSIGLEVEGVSVFETVPGSLKGLVVGEVVECGSHPNADKLSLTKVDIEADEHLQIVCGAPNVAEGQKVIVATVGTTIYPLEGEPFTIGKAKIRGVSSRGMICAEDEIGLGSSHDGIMVLDPDTKVGTPAADLFDISIDHIYDIGLTPNRSDATSHIGVARDVMAYLRINSEDRAKINLPDLSGFKPGGPNNFKVKVKDTVACPRYSGLVIKGVKVGPSPEWLQNRLRSVGQRPINNVVDITNFVLQEMGQPLHAFDLDKINGNGIVVQKAESNSVFKTLDEVERKLNSEDLLICDAELNPLCLAGVFGGFGSGVTEETTDLFLESAHFEAISIRKTSTRHLLRTDAAKIFEKGSDPSVTIDALKRAALLIAEYAGGYVDSEVLDIYPNPKERVEIELNFDKVRRLTGAPVSNDQIVGILRAMEMELGKPANGSVKVKVPTNKSDVTREADLIEEILRIYGFDNVPFSDSIHIPLISSNWPDKHTLTNKAADYLAACGFSQMMNLSLVKSDWYKGKEKELVFVENTSNESLNVMRPDMIKAVLETLSHNINRRQKDLAFFEFGRTYRKNEESILEEESLILVLTGKTRSGNWLEAEKSADFFDMKRSSLNLLEFMGVNYNQIEEIEGDENFSYGIKLSSAKTELIRIGMVSTDLLRQFDIESEVFVAEINWPEIVKRSAKAKTISEPVNKYPSVERDLALVMPEQLTYEEISNLVAKSSGKLLDAMQLFDVYRDEEKIGKGKKSYAIRLVFSDPTKTLTDKNIDKVIKKILGTLKHQLNVELR